MFFWSEHPQRDMWNHLRFLASVSNAKRLLTGDIRSGREFAYPAGDDVDKKAAQVAMCVAQADEYFTAADQVSIRTSPVLLFYGMLCLAKALVVANKRDVFLEQIAYHGLHRRAKSDELRRYEQAPSSWTMEHEYAVTANGVFKHLTALLDGFTFEDDTVVQFEELLAVCPEISAMYELYFGQPAAVLRLYSIEDAPASPVKKDMYILTRYQGRELTDRDVFERIPELAADWEIAAELYHEQARMLIPKHVSAFPDYVGIVEPAAGGRYLVGGIRYQNVGSQRRRFVSPAIAHYLAMFILSTCARYKQDFWGDVVEGKATGILSLIEQYLVVIKRSYPHTILNSLFGLPFDYGSQATWG